LRNGSGCGTEQNQQREDRPSLDHRLCSPAKRFVGNALQRNRLAGDIRVRPRFSLRPRLRGSWP